VAGTICNAAGFGGVAGAGGIAGAGGTAGTAGGVGRVAGFSGGICVVVHAASESATTESGTSRLRRVNDIRIAMWVLMLEACVAFFLLVFIVWWTMYQGKGKNKKLPPPARDDDPK
jgi:plastocyanin domain-containing protein